MQGNTNDFYHWHLEIIPKLAKTAGFEWGTGFYINRNATGKSSEVFERGEGRGTAAGKGGENRIKSKTLPRIDADDTDLKQVIGTSGLWSGSEIKKLLPRISADYRGSESKAILNSVSGG